MFNFSWFNKKLLAVGAVAFFLGGCGGSSSSSPPPPPPPPPPANVAPVANAGPDQSVVELTDVTLDGSASADSDGTISSYAWTQAAGTAVTLDDASLAMPTFTAPDVAADEDLTFQLVVTDDDGAASAADSVVITVTAAVGPNDPPTANAGPDQSVDELSVVTLDGTGSTDTDGTIASYAWTQTGGTIVALDLATPSMPTFTAPDVAADQDLTFQLIVTDNGGASSAADTVVITVLNNVAPTANAGPDQVVNEGDPVTLDGSASNDPDGTIVDYTWTQTTGTAVVLDETDPAMPTFTAPSVGGAAENLTFELVVTDDDGATSSVDDVVIAINPTLTLPFSDNFNDGNSDGWTAVDDDIENASAWSAGTGRLVQTVSTNNFGGDVTETYRRGTYQWYADSVNLTNYRFSVEVTPRPGSSDDIGVLFRYTDNDNYYRFTMNSEAGGSRLESNINGTFVTLAHDFRGYNPNALQRIVVEVDGPLIQVYVNDNPLFAARDVDHPQGGFGLYTRDGALFDNVSVTVNDPDPAIVIESPEAHNVWPEGPRNVQIRAVARNVPPATGSVILDINGVACDPTVAVETGYYSALCPNVPVGNYLVTARIRDNGINVDSDSNSDFAIGAEGVGDRWDAIGDSLTLGFLDRYATDNLNLNDQITIGFQGWTGPLGDLLTDANGAPNLVGNEGIPGDRVRTIRFDRLPSIFERNSGPSSNRALLLAGTNDSSDFNPTPSGLGCAGSGCNNTYKGDMEWIILNLQAAGRDVVYVAQLPPVWGSSAIEPVDPTRNPRIIDYNSVIETQLSILNGVELGPDFYECFLTTENRFSLFEDTLHPNSLGYAYMAALWADAITSGGGGCATSVYLLDALDSYANGHKQNLLEEGDVYYRDENFTLENIPPELEGGVWVSMRNADNANADADFLSFDVGSTAVTVYIAYDPAGGTGLPPTNDSGLVFAAATLTGTLDVSDAAVGTMSVVEATGVTGTVTLGGNKSGGGPDPQQGYIVIVVP